MSEQTVPDPTVPVPLGQTRLRAFAYDRRGAWLTRTGECADPDLAEEFHEASKIDRLVPGQALGPAGPLLVTTDAAFALGRKALTTAGPAVPLPPAEPIPVDLAEVTARRRSGLPDDAGPIDLDELGSVLALSAGASPTHPGLRVTPSGGAMYPLDVLVIAHRVTGLEPGGYHYDPIAHALRPRGELDPAAFHDSVGTGYTPPQPAVTLALVATFARSRAKYGLRGYRFALMESGHIAQAVLTVATALGLAALPWGGFADTEVDRLLDLDGVDRGTVYLVALSGTGRS